MAKELLAIRVCDKDAGEQRQQEHGLPACPANRRSTDLAREPDLFPGLAAGLEHSLAIQVLATWRRLWHSPVSMSAKMRAVFLSS
jgi:hypothetical protein